MQVFGVYEFLKQSFFWTQINYIIEVFITSYMPNHNLRVDIIEKINNDDKR